MSGAERPGRATVRSPQKGPLKLATRRSPLALWQAEEVARRLRAAHPGLEVTLLCLDSAGDRRPDQAVAEIGVDGVFVAEIRQAVLDGRADAAVHSAKDLPSAPVDDLVLVAVPRRDDPRDALVGSTLAGLPPGATVATGSPRRRAQLAWLRPDLTFTGLRGNLATRVGRVPPGGAVVVAYAALARLGMEHLAAEVLDPWAMLPQAGQGAIALECRDGDPLAELLGAVDDASAHRALDAERGFLARLGGGCDLPAGALATVGPATVTVEGVLASADGYFLARHAEQGPLGDPAAVGAAVADRLLVASPAWLR